MADTTSKLENALKSLNTAKSQLTQLQKILAQQKQINAVYANKIDSTRILLEQEQKVLAELPTKADSAKTSAELTTAKQQLADAQAKLDEITSKNKKFAITKAELEDRVKQAESQLKAFQK